MVKPDFTNDELYWIERTADIESTLCLKKFLEIIQIPKEDFEKNKDMLLKYSSELIDSYTKLKTIRIKCESYRNP